MMLEDAVFILLSEENQQTDVDYNLDLSVMCAMNVMCVMSVMCVMRVIRCYNNWSYQEPGATCNQHSNYTTNTNTL